MILIATIWSLFSTFGMAQSDYKTIHQQSLVVDTHADVLLQVLRGADISKKLESGHVDLIRLKEGGVDVQVFAVWPNPESEYEKSMYKQSVHLIDLFDTLMQNNPDKIVHTRSPEEIMKAQKENIIAACLGLEGGTAIENDLDKLQYFYDRGVRYMSLTWNDSPEWASSAHDEISAEFAGNRGLSEFGKEVIRKMNEMGMIVDVSHSGEKTFWDVIATSTKPIIASHSCVYSICPHYRNLKDDQIKALADNDGVLFINFYPGYLKKGFDRQYQSVRNSTKAYLDSVRQSYGDDILGYRKYRSTFLAEQTKTFRPTVDIIVDHMDYIINLVGDDHVGLGSDFDGISITPAGIDDVSEMPEITKVMIERGYSQERVQKILGGNFMRVFREVSKN